MSDLAPIWLDAPCPALELWRDAGPARWRLNRAAVEWALDAQAERSRLAGAGAAIGWRGADRGERPAALSAPGRLPDRAVAVPPRWLLWLRPEAGRGASPRSGRHECRRQAGADAGLRPHRLRRARRAQRPRLVGQAHVPHGRAGAGAAAATASSRRCSACIPTTARPAAPPSAGDAAGRPLRDALSARCCPTAGSATCRR